LIHFYKRKTTNLDTERKLFYKVIQKQWNPETVT